MNMFVRRLLPLLALLLLVSCDQRPSLIGTVVGVHDGDTLTLLMEGNQRVKVRFDGIDAPELGQAHGQASKASLSELAFGKIVRVRVSGADRYKRTLGQVYDGKVWINLAQVQRGYAWHYAHYSKDGQLRRAQAAAKKQRLGLWNDRIRTPPWEWRKSRRST